TRFWMLEPFAFLVFVGSSDPALLPKLVPSLLSPLLLPFRHPAVLRDQVDEHPQIGEYDQCNHPNRLAPTRYVVPAKQIAEHCDQQPEPQHKDKYRKDIGEKVGESETAWK